MTTQEWHVTPTTPEAEDVPVCPKCQVALPPGEQSFSMAQNAMITAATECESNHQDMAMNGICQKCGFNPMALVWPQGSLRQCPCCFQLFRVEPGTGPGDTT